jgi:hypothetical protein
MSSSNVRLAGVPQALLEALLEALWEVPGSPRGNADGGAAVYCDSRHRPRGSRAEGPAPLGALGMLTSASRA